MRLLLISQIHRHKMVVDSIVEREVLLAKKVLEVKTKG
jgi:hypothetical protein